MRDRILRRVAVAGPLLLLCLVMTDAWRTLAQSDTGWSDPELIYETVEPIDAPFLSSDRTGVTHLVWRETQRDTDLPDTRLEAIFYTNDLDSLLGQGRDIVAMSGLIGPIVAGDAGGLVHLVWRGPDNTLYYSQSSTTSARSALSWADPGAISVSNANAHILVDPERVAHVVFPGTPAMGGTYYTRYDVDNDAWIAPVMISLTASDQTSADFTRIAIGPDGKLHVVWSEYLLPEGWPPTGIYYAQSADGGETWSRATELEGKGGVQGNIAVDSRGRVHVAWNRMVGIGGRYHRWSNDGGLSWSPIAEVAPAKHGGTEGPPQLAIDSADTLHMLMTYDGCAWYARWVNGVWSEPKCISGREAMASGYIEEPAMSIANGNELHAVFWDDRARLWHTRMTTEAPYISPIPTAVAEVSNATINEPPVVTPEPTALPAFDRSAAPSSGRGALSGPAQALLPATVVVSLLLALILLVKLIRSR